MTIKELTIEQFTKFANKNELGSYMQTKEYARFMAELGYNYDYVGMFDNKKIVAASLILWKKIGFNMKYGYAPKGFLVNYYDQSLLQKFTDELKKYYSKKNFVFIKINPEIVVGSIDTRNLTFINNPNSGLIKTISDYGYKKLKNNVYFESINPRFEAYIDLKTSSMNKFSKATRNKIRNSMRKGLSFEKFNSENIEELSPLLVNGDIQYYKKLFSIFEENSSIDLYVVRADFEKFVKTSQKLYEQELDRNHLYSEIIHRSQKKNDLNTKMNSDILLTRYRNEITLATEGLTTNNHEIVAYAILIRYQNRVYLLESNFSRRYLLNQNYFLYYSIIENYKEKFEYLSLGGVSGDFKKTSPYYTLGRFKIGFNAQVYEFIGEFDLIISKPKYEFLLKSGKLAQEFNKEKS